jgi:hypothetical protein
MRKIPSFLRWILIITAVVFFLWWLKDFVIKTAIEMSSSKVIGAQMKMGGFSLDLFKKQVHIRDFKMYNPPGFPDRIFLTMPEVAVDIDLQELRQGRMHFPLVIFNLDQVVVFKNKEGKLNIDSIKIIEEQKAANKGKPTKLPVFKIHVLKINIGKVIMEDYTRTPTLVQGYDVRIKDKTIKNIDGVPKLVTAVLIEAIKPTAIRSAGLLAAEALMGVGFLPAAAIGVVIASDDAKADFKYSADRAYKESLKLVQEIGSVKKENLKERKIIAKVYGADVTIMVEDKGWNKSHVTIKCRKYMLAKAELANGLIYQLTQRLK